MMLKKINGINYSNRWFIPSSTSDRRDVSKLKAVDETVKYADLCDILRIKLSTYADYPINRHMMNDGSGDFFGCIWK